MENEDKGTIPVSQDDADGKKFNETLKRMLKTPPKPKNSTVEDKGGKTDKTAKDKNAQSLLSDVRRLRSDVAFLSRVTRQLRDVAITAHIAARRAR